MGRLGPDRAYQLHVSFSCDEGLICMPDYYSPKLFLQQIPKQLLREFFTRRGELGDLDWDRLDDADVDPILNAWHALPGPQRVGRR